jgi:predicted deacylase
VYHSFFVQGKYEGPVLGITAALHGNEINGIPLIHQLFRELDVRTLAGTVVAIPVLNTPGFLRHQRGFSDNKDLNTVFPGKPKGNCSQTYCFNLLEKVISKFNYLIDLHTAGYGRANSVAVFLDMNDRIAHQMALLQDPNTMIHSSGQDGSLRAAAMKLGISSITVEMGDPSSINRVCSFFTRFDSDVCSIGNREHCFDGSREHIEPLQDVDI